MRNWIFQTSIVTSSRAGFNCPALYHTNITRSDAHTHLHASVNLFISSKTVPLMRIKLFFKNCDASNLRRVMCKVSETLISIRQIGKLDFQHLQKYF